MLSGSMVTDAEVDLLERQDRENRRDNIGRAGNTGGGRGRVVRRHQGIACLYLIGAVHVLFAEAHPGVFDVSQVSLRPGERNGRGFKDRFLRRKALGDRAVKAAAHLNGFRCLRRDHEVDRLGRFSRDRQIAGIRPVRENDGILQRGIGRAGKLGHVDLRIDVVGVETADNAPGAYDLHRHGAGIHICDHKIFGVPKQGLPHQLNAHAAEGLLEFFRFDACHVNPQHDRKDQGDDNPKRFTVIQFTQILFHAGPRCRRHWPGRSS